MPKTLLTSNGTLIQLGAELGKGGEGAVYEVLGSSGQVAKLYLKMPDTKKQAKLRFMAASVDQELLKYAAWPQDTLHTIRGGPVGGFLMPKISGRAPIHMLYSPAHRRQDYPKAGWDFLLFAARNTAAAFATLHAHGHVLGDVNQGNVLVGNDSKVVLIDCDSFQINANGTVHLCEVGVSHFTPPELQGLPSFDGVKRSFNHDNFGLALLIFHLLFGGRHPYSGVPLRKDVGEALETDIKNFRFAYSRDAKVRGVAPPPKSIPLTTVPDAMEEMFELAFTERGASGGRPTSQRWVVALDALRGHLRKCGTTPTHIFPNHLANCPWCALEAQGVVYFIDIGVSFTNTPTGFVLARVWAAIEAVPVPPSIPVASPSSIPANPTPLPAGMGSDTQTFVLRFLIVGGAIGLFALAPKMWLFVIIGAWIAWVKADSTDNAERRAEKSRREEARNVARKTYEALEARIRKEAGPEGFNAKKQALGSLRDEYQRLGTTEQNDLAHLHATAEERQRQQFLDRCFIDSASISGVGPAKKAALRSFGIETAADVNWHTVRAVRGFGDVLTRAVVDWKKAQERRFVFNPRAAVSEADKNAVRAKIATRRKVLEAALGSGAAELNGYRHASASKATSLLPQLKEAAQKVAQAEADLSVM